MGKGEKTSGKWNGNNQGFSLAGNIRDGTGRYCFDMFGGKNLEDGRGRDGTGKYFERSEFLIATSKKYSYACVVCSTNLGFSGVGKTLLLSHATTV